MVIEVQSRPFRADLGPQEEPWHCTRAVFYMITSLRFMHAGDEMILPLPIPVRLYSVRQDRQLPDAQPVILHPFWGL